VRIRYSLRWSAQPSSDVLTRLEKYRHRHDYAADLAASPLAAPEAQRRVAPPGRAAGTPLCELAAAQSPA
jgi:hypothetical protein